MEVSVQDFEKIDSMMEKYGREKSSLMNVLNELQNEYHYLPKELLEIVSQEYEIPFNQLYGLGTFYNSFFLKPLGKYKVNACTGTTCYNEGSKEIVDNLENELKMRKGKTREDGLFTLLELIALDAAL